MSSAASAPAAASADVAPAVSKGKRKRVSVSPEETEEEDLWDSADGRSTVDEEIAPYPYKQVPSPKEGELSYFTEKRENIRKRQAIEEEL